MNNEIWQGQPDPIKNENPAVWDLVLKDMESAKLPPDSDQEKIHKLLLEDFKKRDIAGQLKYKTRLQPFNSRNSLQDAFEESLDKIVYLRQSLYEEQATLISTTESEFFKAVIGQLYRAELDSALKLKFIIEKKKELNKNVVIVNSSNN